MFKPDLQSEKNGSVPRYKPVEKFVIPPPRVNYDIPKNVNVCRGKNCNI
jgi:hypothetical protein